MEKLADEYSTACSFYIHKSDNKQHLNLKSPVYTGKKEEFVS